MNGTIALWLELVAGFIVIGMLGTISIAVVLSWWVEAAEVLVEQLHEYRNIATGSVLLVSALSAALSGIAALLRGPDVSATWWFIASGVLGMAGVVLVSTGDISEWWQQRKERKLAARRHKQQRRRQHGGFLPPDDNDEFLGTLPKSPRR